MESAKLNDYNKFASKNKEALNKNKDKVSNDVASIQQ